MHCHPPRTNPPIRDTLSRVSTQSLPDLEALGLLVTVVEQGGFTAAARAIGATKALVSRRIRELELRLGTQLLARTTRSVQLTDDGRRYFEPAQRALRSAREAELSLVAGLGRPVGLLRVTTTAILADMLLEPVAVQFLNRYPDVTLELAVSARTSDLVREGFDLAIRAGSLPDSSLTVRRLGEARTGYFASPEYVARHGAPADPQGLARHAIVAIGDGPTVAWPFARDGRSTHISVRPRLLTPSHDLAFRAALAGLGIARLPEFYARARVTAAALVPVLGAWTPPPIAVHVLSPPGIRPAKTRAFIDLVAHHLGRHAAFGARPS